MFSEVRGALNSSKLTFLEKVNDSFGNSIINDVYEPFEKDLQNLSLAWDEAEAKNAEIMALLIQLRIII